MLAAASELLAAIERLPPRATGALHFGREGVVLLEAGLVCWAVASGMELRLSELLRNQRNPPLDPAALERLVRECHERRTPLGEALVESGQVTADGLRLALFRQTAEAIAHIARGGATPDAFVAHARSGYDARFVFRPVELLASLGGRRHRAAAAAARAHLAATLVAEASAVAFVRDAGEAVLVAAAGDASVRVADVVRAGAYAAALFDAAHEIDPRARIAVASAGGAGALVCWRAGDALVVAPCSGRALAVRLVAALSAALSAPLGAEEPR
jgi:hypothetical protein